MYSDSNIKAILTHENFGKFSFEYYSDDFIDEAIGLSPLSNMQNVIANCKSFIKNFNHKVLISLMNQIIRIFNH
jgi:DNA replication protein DnaC